MPLESDRNMFAGMLENRKVVVSTGASISIYRMPDVIRDLRREGAEVEVAMSRNSRSLINPEVMKWASEKPVITEITGDIEHIRLFIGKSQNTVLLISPASYDVIGKIANGIADDIPEILFSFAFGHGIRTVIAPAMHKDMMTNRINMRNIDFLKESGVSVIEPAYDEEKAKLSDSRNIVDSVCRAFYGNELKDKKVMIVSGRGEEPIDPVRVITNKGTGFTGYWFARNSYRLGAGKITYVGNSTVDLPSYVEYRECYSTEDIRETALEELKKDRYDIVLVPASLSDFTIGEKSASKISSDKVHALTLKPRGKIIRDIRAIFQGTFVVFNLSEEKDTSRIRKKYSDMSPDFIVCNEYGNRNGPFGKHTNSYLVLTEDQDVEIADSWKPEFTLKLLRMISEKAKGKGS